jgi:DNA repair ATPase RecN
MSPTDVPVAPVATPPASIPHHRIESLTIEGGVHFRSVHLPLVDGLNCLIGPMGAGKTTILQSLRYGIGTATADPRAAKNDAQVEGTLGTGTVAVGARTQHGQGYRSDRCVGEAPRVTTESGEHAPVSLDGDLFKIEIYGQNEIQAMAEKPAAQLALIDKFADAEIRALEDAIAQVEGRLTLNAAEVTRLESEIADVGDRTSELPTVAAALQALTAAAGPDADEARHAHEAKALRTREQATLRELRDELRRVLAGADAFEVEARRRLGAEMTPVLQGSVNRAVLEPAHAASRAALGVIQDAVTRMRSALASAEGAVTAAGDVLGAAHAGQDAAYDALNRKHDVDRGRLAERERFQRRYLELEALEKKLSDRRREHAACAAEAQTLRDERARLLALEVAVRRRVASEINAVLQGRLDVTIVGGGDSEDYYALLLEMLKGANLRTELVKEIARNIRPDDLAAAVRANDPTPIQAIDEAKTGKVERAQKVIDALRASGKVARLDIVRLRDVPVIRLNVGGGYVVSTELSFGQRCTAILPILLIQSAAPLIIDQPEDQLDSAFVYDVLVPTLKAVKKSRQIIFATPTPTILVLGETDRVFVLEGTRSAGRLTEFGTVDEVRGSIERLVEGGREAFLLRSARYGHTSAK